MKHVALAALALSVVGTMGCSTLPQHYSSHGADDASILDMTEYAGAATESEGAEQAAAAPGQTTVAWEDNGHPIRELTPQGRPRSMELPSTAKRKYQKAVAAQASAVPSTLPTE